MWNWVHKTTSIAGFKLYYNAVVRAQISDQGWLEPPCCEAWVELLPKSLPSAQSSLNHAVQSRPLQNLALTQPFRQINGVGQDHLWQCADNVNKTDGKL